MGGVTYGKKKGERDSACAWLPPDELCEGRLEITLDGTPASLLWTHPLLLWTHPLPRPLRLVLRALFVRALFVRDLFLRPTVGGAIVLEGEAVVI